MREPENRDRQGRELRHDPSRADRGLRGHEPGRSERLQESDHRWAADEPEQWPRPRNFETSGESWSRPASAETNYGPGQGRQSQREQQRFNEFEDHGFTGGSEANRYGRGRELGAAPGERSRGEHLARERYDAAPNESWDWGEERSPGLGDSTRRGGGRERWYEDLRERQQQASDRAHSSAGRGFDSRESAPLNWPHPRIS